MTMKSECTNTNHTAVTIEINRAGPIPDGKGSTAEYLSGYEPIHIGEAYERLGKALRSLDRLHDAIANLRRLIALAENQQP